MGRASHKAGEDEFFQVLMKLDGAKRTAASRFQPASVLGEGTGTITYGVGAPGGGRYFSAGPITWTAVRYER